jgi:Ala-tRNA(Pro) deacylase
MNTPMVGQQKLYVILNSLQISFEYYEHPPVPTVREAAIYWKEIAAQHCKNIFFRNHKGDRHYLVILDFSKDIVINDLEKRLKQGKLSFASEQRLEKYLGLKPGSVSPFGLVNDKESHVHVFLDNNLQNAEKLSFHPNINTASLVVSNNDFLKFMNWTNNTFEFITLYD